ncbi:unnamed protein product [Aspergillus oryzae]|uniref:Unnamed protein product n=1 Tax=Aspergillus oryzae TaxID=5062 RepID=A0AAN4YZ29_ASPOZ|nr:unnamed protein product [Aspergillus oryzae]
MNALVYQNCREAGAVVLKLAYGYTVEPHKQDPLVDLADVSIFLPSWFPGTEFKRIGQRSKEAFDNFGGKPYNFVKHQMSQGTHHPSYLSSILESEEIEPGSEKEYVTKWSAASIYAGGADTVRIISKQNSTQVQANLQHRQCPSWHPSSSPWRYVFHDPMTFKPERYLGDNPEPDSHRISFGFGRRICPGRVMADAAIYLNIAQSLAAFNIGKKVVDGKEVEPRVEFQAALISHPEPYDVSIKPRSSVHEELIRAVEEEYPWEKSHADELVNIKV